jgi:hypothetical protein
MITFQYTDSFLRQRVSKPIEQQAIADVSIFGTFPDEWHARLVVIRAYILTCIENLASEEDAFAIKLKYYREIWNEALTEARAAAGTGGTISLFTPILRG